MSLSAYHLPATPKLLYDGLQLYHVRHGQQLWVLAAGEFQPARYKTCLHGCWLVI